MGDTFETTPPTSPPELLDLVEQPKWPKVVGIISIVWGGLALTCGGFGLAMMAFSGALAGMAEGQMGPMPDVMKPGPEMYALGAVGLFADILVIVAGVLTVQRKIAGRMLHLAYAAIGIINTLVYTFFALQQQSRIADWAKQNPDNQWTQGQGGMSGMIGIAIGITLGLAWPLFCLLWFGLVKTKHEQMTGGAQEPAA